MVEILAYKAGVLGGFFCFLIDDRAITFNARSSSEPIGFGRAADIGSLYLALNLTRFLFQGI